MSDIEEAAEDQKAPFKDPKPTIERISQLAGRVLTGDILLPKFQRDFVWPRPKIINLLDSIANNYPIGSVLLWQSKQQLASERTIAGLEIAGSKPDYPVNYLLDGQQRLSTVCGALYWKPANDPTSLWNIAYDLKSQAFLHLNSLDDPPLSFVPMRYLATPSTFYKRMSALDDAELHDRGDVIFNRFQDYMIAAVTLGDMSVEDIAPIFERINSTATPLTIVDLMRAATWSPSFDLRDRIDSLLASLDSKGFRGIEQKTMLRALAAAAGYGFAIDDIDRLRELDVATLEAALAEVEEASKRAVDFLRTHIRVPRPESLPYSNQFAVLVELFRRVKAGDPKQFRDAELWFWRSTLGGYFAGWNTGQMSHDYRAISDYASGAASEIDLPVALPTESVWRVSQFRSNSAISKMLALVLSFQDPVDLLTGQRIELAKSLSWSSDREFHHFFPKNFLKGKGVSNGKANSVANIVLLGSASNIQISSQAPSAYLQGIVDAVGRTELERRAATCLISPQALDFALAGDFEAFLHLRALDIHRAAMALAGQDKETGDASLQLPMDEVATDEPLPPDSVA